MCKIKYTNENKGKVLCMFKLCTTCLSPLEGKLHKDRELNGMVVRNQGETRQILLFA